MTASALGSWSHLAGRFFEVLVSRPLTGDEVDWLAGILDPAEMEIFSAQMTADQLHGYIAGRHVEGCDGARDELVRAAILHDVGKRHARLGVAGRVVASMAMKLGLPVRGRFALYRDHGRLGAADLDRIGSSPEVVEYAAFHHGPPVDGMLSEQELEILDAADSSRRILGRP